MNMECFSICLCLLLFHSTGVCSSPWRGPLHFYVSCIPRYLFFLLQLWMGVRSWFDSVCLLLVYRNACDFCTLILYPETLLKLLICLRRVWAEAMGSSKYIIMSSANRDNLTSSFPNWIPFISFSCLISLAKTSNTILNKSGETGHPCLVPDFKENVTSFCPSVWYWLWVCHK